MKELARKGNVRIGKRIDGIFYLDCYGIEDVLVFLNPSELSDLKDCISRVTAKKIEAEKDINGVLYFRCPDCNTYVDRDDGYCSRCGLKLEGVEE